LISNLGNDASPAQLPSVHHNTSCDGCASDAGAEGNAKRAFSQQNVTKERLGAI